MNSHDKEIRDAVKVDLKEHLQVLVREQDRRIEQATRDSERALRLQATEYERRLDDLNHTHAQTRRDQEQYMPREKFEVFSLQVEARLRRQELWAYGIPITLVISVALALLGR